MQLKTGIVHRKFTNCRLRRRAPVVSLRLAKGKSASSALPNLHPSVALRAPAPLIRGAIIAPIKGFCIRMLLPPLSRGGGPPAKPVVEGCDPAGSLGKAASAAAANYIPITTNCPSCAVRLIVLILISPESTIRFAILSSTSRRMILRMSLAPYCSDMAMWAIASSAGRS